jgi:hypothetical protein
VPPRYANQPKSPLDVSSTGTGDPVSWSFFTSNGAAIKKRPLLYST